MGRKLTNAEFKYRLSISNPHTEALEEYRGSTQKIRCRCRACSYEWTQKANALLLGHGCPRCKGMEKYTPQEFRKQAEKESPNITVLDTYFNNRTKLACRCDVCGYEWKATPHTLLHHAVCPACIKASGKDMNKKERAAKLFTERMRFISPSIEILEPYVQAHQKVRCRCRKCGYEWAATPNNLLYGHGCARCAKKLKLTTAEYIERVRQKTDTIEILSPYDGYKKKVRARCTVCGYEWTPVAGQLIYGHGCPSCKGLRRYTTEHFKERLSQVNPDIEVLGEYVTSQKKILCRCRKCGNEWTPTPANLLNNGAGCPACAKISRVEKIRGRKRV